MHTPGGSVQVPSCPDDTATSRATALCTEGVSLMPLLSGSAGGKWPRAAFSQYVRGAECCDCPPAGSTAPGAGGVCCECHGFANTSWSRSMAGACDPARTASVAKLRACCGVGCHAFSCVEALFCIHRQRAQRPFRYFPTCQKLNPHCQELFAVGAKQSLGRLPMDANNSTSYVRRLRPVDRLCGVALQSLRPRDGLYGPRRQVALLGVARVQPELRHSELGERARDRAM